MQWAPSVAAPWVVQLHLGLAILALLLGLVQCIRLRGTSHHRGIGWSWVMTMIGFSVSSNGRRSVWPTSLAFGWLRHPLIGLQSAVLLLLAAAGAAQADDAARAWGHPFSALRGHNGTVCGTCHQADPYATQASASPVLLASQWWVAGGQHRLPAYTWFKNPVGASSLALSAGALETEHHPFFVALGTNGRACVSCHQPADGMSLSLHTILARWTTTGGRDPLFAMIDGANCPGLPAEEAASHRLLLEKGLFRVGLPWPPRAADGEAIAPEFHLEVVDDPTGCNLDPHDGLHAAEPTVSVFRRPRMAANLVYLEPAADHGPSVLMSDGRAANLRVQMNDAARHHLQTGRDLTAAEQASIRAFERQLTVAQAWQAVGGSLDAAGAALGAVSLAADSPASLGTAQRSPFPEIEPWLTERSLVDGLGAWPLAAPPAHRPEEVQESAPVRAYRDAVARGYALFIARPFVGDDGRVQTCATCHNGLHTGIDVTGDHPGLGVAALSGGMPAADLPLFKATCRGDVVAPRAGRVVYTHDPGRALITGRCADLGEVNAQQLRGLAARAPYFTGGSAATLRDVVTYYDRRFNIGYSADDVDALVHFLEAL